MTGLGARRLVALDGLRGIAAFMVFVHHVQLPGFEFTLLGMDAGVLIFFALSGYLLYAPFVAARDMQMRFDLRSYAIRRTLRILPAYLIAAVAIGALFRPTTLEDPIGILTMAHTPIIVAWTLQLEVAFYLALPLLAWLLGSAPEIRRPFLLVVFGATSIVATVVLMVVAVSLERPLFVDQFQVFTSFLWTFVPGMLVAELQRRDLLRRAAPGWVGLIGLGLIAVSVALDPPSYLDLAAAVGAGLVIAHLVARPDVPIALVKPAAVAGALSYSFYLWHEALIPAVDRPASWIGSAIALTLSLLVAGVVYWTVERPCIALGRRLSRRPGGSVVAWGVGPVQDPVIHRRVNGRQS